ncbi:NAD(P)/FAD-dependent oxidoreductase [Echinimonas agarilytica]|uniref:NAD(P)/FAD-dependent oxidoreductase n=1 Tax=Echinimonas agarilytica TaxID=1215918 RepID=A0AA42B7M1_9GAMM|nr:NAD(P)/FAD-dependent oxidoreductase [Echinimonas agarilytica]
MSRIVIVGGGAGGLELATRLGNKLGKRNKAEVTLVDKNRTHLWKPLLHEVATGALDDGTDAVSYRAHAANHGFDFQLGSMSGIDRDKKQLIMAPLLGEDGEQVLPQRSIDYDYLVIAIGSVSNDFGTLGVKEHCIFLDSPDQAHRFHRKMLDLFFRLHVQGAESDPLRIAIVGGGATGVELSAELHNAARQMKSYGVRHVSQSNLKVSLVEAGERILPALPPRISGAAHQELTKLGVKVSTATMVTEATSEGLMTKDGHLIQADLMVWAAGIKGSDFLKDIADLETNRNNQLVVKPTLQTSRDDSIYVIGDAASCPMGDGKFVPPRAQSAHQMASHAYKNIRAQLNGEAQSDYVYKDHGSLVSLSRFSTVGSLMGNLTNGSMMVEGRIARMVYISLYRMHQVALHGYFKTAMVTFSDKISRVFKPKLKLH